MLLEIWEDEQVLEQSVSMHCTERYIATRLKRKGYDRDADLTNLKSTYRSIKDHDNKMSKHILRVI